MKLIDTITVRHQGNERLVMLFVGDLAHLPEHESVDVLIVSAFPDNYRPSRTSLIGSLDRAGVSVAELAKEKEVDLRQFSSCWLSRPIAQPGVHFRRVLCFEPRHRGQAPEVVGDVFRSIVPFTSDKPAVSQVAMSLLASGNQGEPAEVMLEALTDASVHWLSVGLPLDRIKIVLHDSVDSQSLRETFARVKRHHAEPAVETKQQSFRYDVFVSYSQKNKNAIDDLVGELRAARPSLRVFLDRLELHPGTAWQQHIFKALEESRKVICAFSPDYLISKVCNEEYNIALLRHRESADGVLLPIYLYTANLPFYMRVFQYEDVREGDRAKFLQAAGSLLKQL